jgi:recombination protein RecT
MAAQNQITIKPVDKLKAILNVESIQTQFKNALKDNAPAFISSIVELFSSDKYLQECDPNLVIMEAFKAATLKLPLNKQLGFSYLVPYKQGGVQKPQFQIGYKGYIQLAMRTGQYRYINADVVYEGTVVKRDLLTGKTEFSNDPTSEKAIGYFAYIELLNGFSKTVYITREEIVSHAKRYSKSYSRETSAWHSNFDEMAIKTALRRLLTHYGILSTEMISVLTADKDFEDDENNVQREVENNANTETIDIDGKAHEDESVEPEVEQPTGTDGPGF